MRRRLLVVALHRIDEPAFVARIEIADAEPRLVDIPRPVDQPLAVWRQHGAERRAPTALADVDLPGLAVVTASE